MQIRLASETDLEQLHVLFDQFRQSCGQESHLSASREFIKARLQENDSVIFIALEGTIVIGFIQLYPSYSSLLLKPVWFFDDVYVMPEFRGGGVATSLKAKAKELALDADVVPVTRVRVEGAADVAILAQDKVQMYLYHSVE